MMPSRRSFLLISPTVQRPSRMLRFFLFLTLTSLSFAQDARPTPFVPDSSAAVLRTLSVDIGPRPMGSAAERRALAFAADRLRAAGIDDVRVMDIATTPPGIMGRVRNTHSGITVGTLHGSSGRIIVIGAHIDSASPEIPGTNDDGSGTAVVLELARVMAQRSWQHTIVFCLFGGEEGGLVGSRYFVDHYESIDSVDLMLQVDMANGVDALIPFVDKGTTQTPPWLLRAAQEELLAMGYGGLTYPVHFFTWNIASGSGASSDHEPFLVRGIPAMDFTTDVTDPIHTPQDSWEWFRRGGLERSGDLVYRLVERFDAGMPADRTGSYMTIPFGSTFLLIPTWLLWTLIIVSLISALYVLVLRWPTRSERQGTTRPRVPGLKTFGALWLIWLCVWAAENVGAVISGWRSPWFSNPWLVIVPAVSVGLASLVIIARWARRWNMSSDPVRYLLRSTIWFGVLIGGASLLSPRLAAYFALGLSFNVLAWTLRPAWLKTLAIFLGAYPALRLLTPEFFPFVARMFAQIPLHGVLFESAMTAGLALVCSLVALPYAFGALAVVRDPSVHWPSRFSYRRPVVVWAAILFAVLSIGAMSMLEPYSAARPRSVKVTHTITEGSDSLTTSVQSSEWLRGLVISTRGDTLVPGPVGHFDLPATVVDLADWLRLSSAEWTTVDAGASASGLLTVSYRQRPLQLTVTVSPVSARLISCSAGLFAVNLHNGSADVSFDPPAEDNQLIPLSIALTAPDTVALSVEAAFTEPAFPVDVVGAPVNVERRTIVRATRRVFIPIPPSLP